MTAFVAWALAESGDQSLNLDKALNYLRSHPQELSNMYSKALAANAFLAMRALLEASARSLDQEFESPVTLLLNAEAIETFRVNKDNRDVMKQIDLTKSLRAGENRIQFK